MFEIRIKKPTVIVQWVKNIFYFLFSFSKKLKNSLHSYLSKSIRVYFEYDIIPFSVLSAALPISIRVQNLSWPQIAMSNPSLTTNDTNFTISIGPPKNFKSDSHQEKSKLLKSAVAASPVIQISLGSESVLIFRPRKLRVAKVVAKCSKVLKCPEIL